MGMRPFGSPNYADIGAEVPRTRSLGMWKVRRAAWYCWLGCFHGMPDWFDPENVLNRPTAALQTLRVLS